MSERDGAVMPSLTQLVRSLGNAGALTNVRAILDERVREQWLVDGLVSRLAVREAQAPAELVAEPARHVA